MKWRNSKERELIAQGGSREQTLPTKNNPNPDLSDPQPHRSQPTQPTNHLEAMAKTRLAFNETLWTLPPPLQNNCSQNDLAIEEEASENEHEEDEDLEEDDEEINVT